MKLNSYRAVPDNFAWPEWPELCGPEQLSEGLQMLMRRVAEHPPTISDAGLKRLVELVYFASQSPEEGRFPRFTTIVKDEAHFFVATQLGDLEVIGVDTLRRIAPTCTGTEHALWVTEMDDKLSCRGLVTIDPQFRHDGQLAETPLDHGPALVLRVHGPGYIQGSWSGFSLVLRSGQLRPMSAWWRAPEAQSLFGEWDGKAPLPGTLRTAFSRIIGRTIALGHGGCFVVLPHDHGHPPRAFPRYHSSGLNLAQAATGFAEACATRKSRSGLPDRELRWREDLAWRKLLAAADTVSRCSCVDGCVVLTRQLEMIGFGGEIKVREDDLRLQFRNRITGETCDGTDLSWAGGTRHRSALRLCMSLPGTFAVVVSQDGHLKLFSSDSKHAYGTEHILADE
jgi:hypothetical protein